MAGIVMPIMGTVGQSAARVDALPNIQFWYDASSETYFVPTNPSNDADLSNWNSKLTSGRNAGPVGGTNKPQFKTNQAKDNLPAVYFENTDNLATNLGTLMNAIPGYTLFIVVRPIRSATGTAQKFVELDNGELGFGVNADGNYFYSVAGGTATGPYCDNQCSWKVHTIDFNGTRTGSDRLRHRVNGGIVSLTTSVDPGSVSLTDGTTVDLELARDTAGSEYMRGYIGEVMLCTSSLSSGEIITVENYLKNKWIDPTQLFPLQVSLDAANYSGSGTSWTDDSGNANTATLVNAPTYSTTNMGQFDFNGTSQYVNLGDYRPSRSRGFSFNVWVNFDSLTGWQTFVGQDRSGDSVGRGAFYFQKATDGATGGDGTSNTVCIKIVDTSDNTIFAEDTTTVTTGVWYNFTATVSATELKLYKNGALVTTNTDSTAMAPATGDMLAGAGWYADAVVDYVNGKMPIVQYWESVLTADEVSDLYDQYSYRYTAATSGLYAQYLIEDYSGTTLTDSSGNSRDGDIVGATYNADGYFTLDGVNDYLVTDNMYGAISASDTHTVEMWVYANASNDCLWSDLGSTNDPATSGYHFAGSQIIQVGPFHQIITGLWNGTAITRDVGAAGSLTGAWKHVVRTYNGTTLTSYVNATNTSGGVTMTFDSPKDDATNNWYIAAGAEDTTTYSGSTAGWLNGRIGIIRVYDRALSSAEVLANYNGSKAKYGL